MKKLLHERLREYKKGMCTGRRLAKAIGCEEPECIGFGCTDCTATLFDKLADEIERSYTPNPRFEDGEPVQWGEENIEWIETELGEKHSIDWCFNAVSKMGNPIAYAEYNNEVRAVAKMKDGFVVRKQPKVLDADGVEINVGDTVWIVGRPQNKMKVVEINGIVAAEVTSGSLIGEHVVREPDSFTHKEPDSLEKLRDEIASQYAQGCQIPRSVWGSWADRLSALIERGA